LPRARSLPRGPLVTEGPLVAEGSARCRGVRSLPRGPLIRVDRRTRRQQADRSLRVRAADAREVPRRRASRLLSGDGAGSRLTCRKCGCAARHQHFLPVKRVLSCSSAMLERRRARVRCSSAVAPRQRAGAGGRTRSSRVHRPVRSLPSGPLIRVDRQTRRQQGDPSPRVHPADARVTRLLTGRGGRMHAYAHFAQSRQSQKG
jgi:hypothetical protein